MCVSRTGPTTQIVSFLEPRSPAWFTVTFDRKTLHPLVLEMIAPAHFMHQRYMTKVSVNATDGTSS